MSIFSAPKSNPLVATLLLGLLASLAATLWPFLSNEGESEDSPLRIAVVSKGLGPDSTEGILLGARLLVDQVNEGGGLNGRPLELDVYDDEGNPDLGKAKAREIADSRALAVIGHRYSAVSLAVGSIYRQSGVPVVSAASTARDVTRNNAWYFRTVFSDDQQARLLAEYTKSVLDVDRVHVVYGPSAYASGLGKKYMEEIKGLGVEMADVYPLTLTSNESDRASPLAGSRAARAILAAASNPRRELVFLSMYPEEAFSLVMRLREESPELKILGVDALASAEFPALFKGRGLEAGAPGFYTDGLYVSTPMIFDTANEFTRQFRNDYQTSYGREPDWRAAFAYDAAKVIVDAMRGAEITGSKASLQEDRQKLRAAIAAFDSPVTAVKGVTGANYFDGNGDPMKSVYVAQYRNGQVISAPYQLAQVVRTTPTVNANGTIEHAGKVEMRLRQVVYTGISAEEVTEVDTDSATARIKGKLWFRFSGELDTSRLIFINAETPVNLGQPLREARLPDGSRYVLYGFEGVFRLDALSEDVRFGEPVIGLGFRHADLDRTRLVFVEDVIGHGRGGHVELLEEILESGAFKPSTGWVPVRARMYSQTVGVAREGQPEYLKEDTARVDYSSFNLAVRAKANELTRRFLNSQSASVLLMLGIPLALLVFHFSTSRRDDPRSRHLAWILEIILAVLVLIAGEILLVDMLDDEINSPYPRLATMIFDMLWWLVPAMLIIINLERHLWRPIEIRSERPIPDLLRGTVAIVVLVFAILGIVAYVFNEKVTSLLATSGMLAMIIGLAVQVNLSHLFSGLAINLERPFRVGDWVKIGDHEEAKVVGVSWRATRLETRDREIIHVPNTGAAESTIKNYAMPTDASRIVLLLRVDTDVDPRELIPMMVAACRKVEYVLEDPEPRTFYLGVTEWASEFGVAFFINDFDIKPRIMNMVWQSIWATLKEAGIEPAIQRQRIELLPDGGRRLLPEPPKA